MILDPTCMTHECNGHETVYPIFIFFEPNIVFHFENHSFQKMKTREKLEGVENFENL